MIEIIHFDLFETDKLEDKIYFVSEQEPFNINFEACDIESTLFILNIDSVIWFTYFYLLLALVSLLFFKIKK